MAKIVTITNPLTGQPAQVDQLDHTAQQIDDGLNIARGVSNPNLLDNWYFANPVNQRGQTSYTGAGYGIDRWLTNGSTVKIKDGYIEWIAQSIYSIFCQKKESESYAGKTIKLSAIAKSTQNVGLHVVGFDAKGTTLTDSFTPLYPSSDFQLIQRTIDVPDGCAILRCGFISLAEGETTVATKAMKLELGSQQTLAHQDANGNWVLNEIPDYGEQLRKCRRYLRKNVWSVATRNSGNYCSVAYDAAEMIGLPSCKIEKLCYIGHTNRDPGESDFMVAESNSGSILLYANLPTMDSYYPNSTSCGIIFTLVADL